MIYEYKVDDIPPSLNKFVGRKNVHAYRNLKNQWKKTIALSCLPKPTEPVKKSVVTLEYWFSSKRRHDPDNYSGKMILDGLTEAGIIEDDSFDNIELRIKQGGVSKQPYTVIRVEVK